MAIDLKQLNEAMVPLKKKFKEKIPETLKSLNDAWERVCAKGASKQDWDIFYTIAHKLAGGAATFGFVEVGEISYNLQILIQESATSSIEFEKNKEQIKLLLQSLNQMQVR